MTEKKVLFVSAEVVPYLPESNLSTMTFALPKMVNEVGGQTRIFIPKYGLINERRHQLHEVIRLSGMNLVINDIDVPLIIKVASIPKERMQVYFIDNDEYFKRKHILHDGDGKLFEDNDERMIFFTKGVIETVKKLNWSPDIILLHGWFTALFPLYMKTYFAEDPIFEQSKLVTALYENDLNGDLAVDIKDKIAFDQIDEDLTALEMPNYNALMELAIRYSDGLVLASDAVDPAIVAQAEASGLPLLKHADTTAENAYVEFFNTQFL